MSESVVDGVLSVLGNVIERESDFHPLHEPSFSEPELANVTECIRTGWVSSAGKYVDKFEQDLASYVGAPYAVAIVNGTAALHLALQIAGVGRDDEVLCPALTFVATANAIHYLGAIPHFVDSSASRLGVDPALLDAYLSEVIEDRGGIPFNRRTNRRIAAIVPMHVFGHPVDMDALNDVADKYQISVVEDAAESLGSKYKGHHTGRKGLLSAFSFNGNKIITTGGGGAIVTDSEKIWKAAKHLSTTARAYNGYSFEHDEVGYNYRMPNLNAALGCAQLEKMDQFVEKKRRLAEKYSRAFQMIDGVDFVLEPPDSRSNYWLCAIMVANREIRNAVLEATNDAGFMTRPTWTLMTDLPMFRDCPSMSVSHATEISDRLINIPSSPNLIGD